MNSQLPRERLFWWKDPSHGDSRRIAAQVMVYGNLADIASVQGQFGDSIFEDVLSSPPPGLFDENRGCSGIKKWEKRKSHRCQTKPCHGLNIDFDFFSSQPLDPLTFKDAMELNGEVIQAGKNTLTLIHHGVKLSFSGGLTLKAISPHEDLEQCPVASLDDLGACFIRVGDPTHPDNPLRHWKPGES
jgi:hypothetical protein